MGPSGGELHRVVSYFNSVDSVPYMDNDYVPTALDTIQDLHAFGKKHEEDLGKGDKRFAPDLHVQNLSQAMFRHMSRHPDVESYQVLASMMDDTKDNPKATDYTLKQLEPMLEELMRDTLASADIIATTNGQILKYRVWSRMPRFTMAFIDEAAQVGTPVTLAIMGRVRTTHGFVLAGDTTQGTPYCMTHMNDFWAPFCKQYNLTLLRRMELLQTPVQHLTETFEPSASETSAVGPSILLLSNISI
jgi:hypothetical protein